MSELPPSGTCSEVKKALPIALALVVGLAVGFWLATGSGKEGSSPRPQGGEAIAGGRGKSAASAKGRAPASMFKGASQEEDDGDDVPPPTVEVMVDDSPEPAAEITAAHAARQALRQAAREAKESERQDFLSSLNLDLLTEEQRRVHALYVEANETRNALRKEISALRREGKEIPADLQVRLADAESVLCADREREQGALREAAARAAGLDESAVRQLTKDLMLIDSAFVP